MQVKEIEINGGKIVEYVLEDELKHIPSTSASKDLTIRQKNLSLDDYKSLYCRENLIEVNGIKYPMVLINEFNDLEKQYRDDVFPDGTG